MINNIGKDLNVAARYINEGKLVVFPTETVYGIGANAFNEEACNKIYKAKNRKSDNPLIVHISKKDDIYKLVKDITKIEERLINNFLGGPFTIILTKNENINNVVSGNLETVGIRMPSDKLALKFIKKCNCPIAAPSANISTRPSGTIITDIYDELKESVSYFIDGGKSSIGIESTIVKVIDGTVYILRPGKITIKDIQNKGFNVKYDDNLKIAPGMKYKHYSPNTKCVLVSGDYISKIKNFEKNCSYLVSTKTYKMIDSLKKINIGNDISRNLYSKLREIDKLNTDICYIEEPKKDDMYDSIINRINKTCEYSKI